VPVICDTLTSGSVVEISHDRILVPPDHRVRYNTRNIREASGIRATVVEVTSNAGVAG
jgi:hypothetical protein